MAGGWARGLLAATTRGVAALPAPLRRAAGAGAGRATGIFLARRRVAARNLEIAFPRWSASRRRRVLARHFECLGRSVFDRFWAMHARAGEMRAAIEIENVDLLPRAGAAIVVAPHFVGMDFGGLRLALERSVVALYRPQHSEVWDDSLRRLRGRFGVELFARVSPLLTRAALRKAALFYYLPDLDGKRRATTVFAPFLGAPAATTATLPRLAKILDAPILPCVTTMVAGGYRVRLYPHQPQMAVAEPTAAARALNDFVGARVAENPEQYYWLHRRFKTRPDGVDVYR